MLLLLFLIITLAMALSEQERSGEVLITALTFMERSYKFGSEDTQAMDCSAFVQKVFAANNIYLPRTTKEQANYGVYVSRRDLKPGDLLFFATYAKHPSHVGIYIGNGKMIHASTNLGITISDINEPYWRRSFLFAKRIIKNTDWDELKGVIDNSYMEGR
ncbi:MAG: C40 family peptidase [Aquificaceae bacterium]